MWALDILAEYGFLYDSSVFPIQGSRYGMGDFPRGVTRVKTGEAEIIEAPLSTVAWLGKNWPAAGGGYFRPAPYSLIRSAVRRVNREGLPFIVYCHPYEFSREKMDFGQFSPPLAAGAARRLDLRFNLFRRGVRGKMERLLADFRFAPIKTALKDAFHE